MVNKNKKDKRVCNDLSECIEVLFKDATLGTKDEAFSFLMFEALNGNSIAIAHLGRAYRDGKGTVKNLNEAARYLRLAKDMGIAWANWELFDVLMRIGTADSMNEAIQYGVPMAEAGDREMQIRVACAYLNGRGVDVDLDNALLYAEKSAAQGLIWPNYVIFDILYKSNEPLQWAKAVEHIVPFANKGNAEALGRLGRAYRDGKGVDKDLIKASNFMGRAADQGLNWALLELLDILWRIETPESNAEYVRRCNSILESGANGSILMKMGRAYRQGKGVEKDLEKAAKFFREAKSFNIIHAKHELFNTLWEINQESSDIEMGELYSDDDMDQRSIINVAKMYVYGRGRDINPDIAKDKLLNLIEIGNHEAYRIFHEMKKKEITLKENTELKVTVIGSVPDSNFTIFSGTHAGSLFDMLNMKEIQHKESNAVLFVTNSFQKKQIVDLVVGGFFDAAIYYDGTIGFNGSRYISKHNIISYFDCVMEESSLNLNHVVNAYLYSDVHDQLGVYLVSKGVKTIVVENIRGHLNQEWRYECFYREGKISEDLYELQKKYRIFSGEKMFGRIKWNEDRCYSDDSFDNVHANELLDAKTKQRILNIFEEYDYANKDVIILNSTNYLKKNGLYEENCKLFCIVMNRYFSDSNHVCTIKLHPYCYNLESFKNKDTDVVSGKTNIDIISYSEKKIHKLINFGSSGSQKIKNNIVVSANVGFKLYSQYILYPIVEHFLNICTRNAICFKQDVIDNLSFNHSSFIRDDRFKIEHRDKLYMTDMVSGDRDSIISYTELDVDRLYSGTFDVKICSDDAPIVIVPMHIYTNHEKISTIIKDSESKYGSIKVCIQNIKWNKKYDSYNQYQLTNNDAYLTEKEEYKEIILGCVKKEKTTDRTRLVCPIKYIDDSKNVVNDSIFFEVDNKYGKYMDSRVSDAFVFASMYYGLIFKCNVRFETPMSEHLHYMLTDFYIPAIANNTVIGGHLYNIQLIGNTIDYKTDGKYVGTGITCGIDSMYSIMKSFHSKTNKLTHNVLVHWSGKYSKYHPAKLKNICNQTGTELVDIATNLTSIFKDLHKIQMPFADFIMASILATRPMWKQYSFSSGYQSLQLNDHVQEDYHFDHFCETPMYCISGSGFHAHYDGGGVSRYTKTVELKDFRPAHEYLTVCFKSSTKNCCWCSKCIRTMVGLDLSNSLYKFDKAFDVEEYHSEYIRYIHYVVLNKTDSFFNELYSDLEKKYPREVAALESIKLDGPEYQKYDMDIRLLMYYSTLPGYYYSRFRIALLYKEGKYFEKDYGFYHKILDGIYNSYDNLSEVILKEYITMLSKDRSWDSILQVLEKYNHSPSVRLLVSRMYRDGKGVTVDINKALNMMKALADEGNAVASNEYVDIIMKESICELYEEAYERTIRLAKNNDSGAQYRIALMYLEGKILDKNVELGKSWMQQSLDNGFPLAKDVMSRYFHNIE